MESLILVFAGAAPAIADMARTLAAVGDVEASDEGLLVSQNNDRVRLRKLPARSAGKVFEEWPRDLVPLQPVLFSLDYRSTEFAGVCVTSLSTLRSFLVDTNFGRVLASEDFVFQRAEPALWTWSDT